MKYNSNYKKKSSNYLFASLIVIFLAVVLVSVLSVILGDTGEKKQTDTTAQQEGNTEITNSGNASVYDQTVQAVLQEINLSEKMMLFHTIDTGEKLLFGYSGGTRFLDKYGQDLTAAQLLAGLIVDISYLSEENKLVKLQISNNAWENIGITGFIISDEKSMIAYHGQRYPLSQSVLVFDDKGEISLSDLLPMDYVTIRGTKDGVCVLKQTKGHGYLRLANDQDYLGGTLTVGSKLMEQIEENMQIPISTGTYNVTVSKGSLVGNKEIAIEKDKTTVFDLYEYSAPIKRSGLVRFQIQPESALLYLDGAGQSHMVPVELSYGEHDIEVMLDGYITYQGTLIVHNTDQMIQITLAERTIEQTDNESVTDGELIFPEDTFEDTTSEDMSLDNQADKDNTSGENDSETEEVPEDYWTDTEEEDQSQGSTQQGNSQQGNASTSSGIDSRKKLTISCTNGTEVYLDGKYLGKISGGKLVTQKYIGTHTIELRYSGYSNKVYTIDIENDGADAELSFPSFV